MAFKTTHIFETRNYGRSIADDGWEKLDPEHIAVWKSALTLLGEREIRLPDFLLRIKADWTPILRQHEQHYEVMKRIKKGYKGEKEFASIVKGFPNRAAKVKFKTEIAETKKARSDLRHPIDYTIESYIHDCFLMLNLCAPGSCDFGRGTLSQTRLPEEIILSNVHFEIALLGSFRTHWPEIRTLALAQTVDWFYSVRGGIGQVPKNPMEKVLFALLHIAKIDTNPMMVIWLFYAFESLFQTRVGENFSSLVRRIILLLELDADQSKILRQHLRSLYDMRSAIIHGGFEIAHPMHNEMLHRRVDESYQRMSAATDYGLTVLVASVQNVISRRWKYPHFTEGISDTGIE